MGTFKFSREMPLPRSLSSNENAKASRQRGISELLTLPRAEREPFGRNEATVPVVKRSAESIGRNVTFDFWF